MKVKHKQLIFTPRSPRSFTVSGATSTIKPIVKNGEIVSLVSKDWSIHLGMNVPIKRRKYKVNIIKERLVGNTRVYDVSSSILTKSSIFVFPMLGADKTLYMFDQLFVNCFIGDDKHKDSIVLLYRFSGDSTFLKFEEALKKFSTFVESYDPSPEYVVFVFRVPQQHQKDFNKFKLGKYSELSGEYKSQLLDFHKFNVHGELASILYRTESKRLRMQQQLNVKIPVNAELHSIIDINQETFNKNDYI